MEIEEVVSLILTVAALIGLGVVAGASIMWRLVHMRAKPPPLPAWVYAVELTSLSLFGIGVWIAGLWLLVISMALLVAITMVQMVTSVRAARRRAGE